jgi:hypothetical protein
MSIGCVSRAQCAVIALALFLGDLAFAKTPVILASGRRDPRIYAIDLNAALRPENNNTPNAIISRSLVSPRRLDGALLGDPANIVLSDDQSTAYVMNHHGSVVNAEFLSTEVGQTSRSWTSRRCSGVNSTIEMRQFSKLSMPAGSEALA